MKGPAAYFAHGNVSPEALVEQYAPLVKRIGAHLRGRLPDNVELDDLLQVGLMALLEAAKTYSSSKGASFETYASIRVRGAMLDEVRSNNWAPRSVYRTQRRITAAISAVENRTGNAAKAGDIAAELGVSMNEYFRMLATSATARMLRIDQPEADFGTDTYATLDVNEDPVAELESVEFREQIVDAIKNLPEREALLLSLYYDDELNFKEIGAVLGVSESRVCQIHAQALARVRARVCGPGDAGKTPRRVVKGPIVEGVTS
jgi:RNA polymerase sigma factor for flagellar operon FliA